MREINKEMLNGFNSKTRIFGQHGRGINISIDMYADPLNKAVWFSYNQNNTTMYIGPSLSEAIGFYNEEIKKPNRITPQK